MKINILFFLLLIISRSVYGQVTLEECQKKALDLYPSVRQTGLIEQAKEYSIDKANTMYMPKLTLSGKATYQSDVTALPIALPGISMETLPKDQYQIVLDLNQPLWDGGRTSSQKELINASSLADRKVLDVELYSLKSRINQIYFGILLLEEQLKQNGLLIDELKTNYNRLLSLQNYGIAKNSDLDTIRVEQLKAEQARIELQAGTKSYRRMLSRMTGISLDSDVQLLRPQSIQREDDSNGLNRPELGMYQAQKEVLDAKKKVISANRMPMINVFIRGGYGRPGLNMLDTEFTSFYLTGLRLNWPLDSFYTRKNEINSIEIQKKMVESRMDTFLYNTGLKVSSQEESIQRLKQQIEKDVKIISLRTSLKKDAEIQLENGTMSVNDLIRRITEENLAVQRKSLHEIQLLQTIYDLNYTINK